MLLDLVEPQRLMREHLERSPVAYCSVGMGIGKTATCLSTLNDWLLDFRVNAALVVAPLRVATITWPNEVAKWGQTCWMRVADLRTPEGRVAFLRGTAQIYTLNYESLHKLPELVNQRGGTLPYEVEVWDEVTNSKSHSSKRINGFRKTMPRAPHRWGLTGTPTPNSLMDLFAQIRLLDDGERLGKAFTRFRDTYFQATDYMQYNWEPRDGAEEKIQKKISDITITLRSQDWLDIPDVSIHDIDVPLPDMKQYREFEKELLMEVKGKVITAANAAVLVTKLLQFTSGTIYDEEKNPTHLHTAKLDALEKLVKQVKKPMLVAVAFRHEMDALRARFPQAKFVEDHGLELFEQWNRGKVPLLVSHPKSIGHGLNLQDGGSHLVWTTMTYSRELYEQMIARIARRGQTAETTVHRLIAPGTADEAVVEALRSKGDSESRLLEALKVLERMRKL